MRIVTREAKRRKKTFGALRFLEVTRYLCENPLRKRQRRNLMEKDGRSTKHTIVQIIEAADKPLLFLALIAVAMYLLELRGVVATT